ncbi:ATP-binding cassette, subfamily B [Treponema bryantii]|uniref:ATP-binding cassette, subfamily B n=1 Tax=Treponema bryantii TaxID=163 RepID=A0A1H9FIA4_9SPIR|nr:ABC transporter ATP-binding protein [Treponema bryantii]SEQ37632.1 ATP-binding cassette, subfamily B [Treponema bryantii]
MFETLIKFFRFCDVENRRKFTGSIIVGIFNSLFMALRIGAVAVMLRGVIAAAIDGTAFEMNTVWLSFAIMCVSIIGGIITRKVTAMWQCEGGYRTCAKKRIEIAEHLRYLPMGYFNENSLGEITSVTTNTMESVGDVATRAVMMVFQGLLDTSLIIVMLFFFDWRIALVALAGFGLFEFVNLFMRVAVRDISAEKIKADAAEIGKVLEYIQGIAEVKAYNLAGKRRRELNSVIEKRLKILIKMEMRCIPVSNLQSLVAKLSGVAMMLASLYFYLAGTMDLANCSTMLVCSFMLFNALEAGGNYSALLRTIDIGVTKASKILALPTMNIEGRERPAEQGKTVQWTVFSESPSSCAAKAEIKDRLNIEARNIDFAYDKRKIIDNISLKIPANTTTAIVGPSGGGKTTFCHLLARFWDVNKGTVTLGEKDVRDYNMDDLMKNYSFVFQNVYLFHDTIANNIRFGEPDAPMEKVIAAAKKACCHDFISALPDGYDTVIGEGGASLSGGEKQRISIARAIMKDAPIIILDEATANVDPENERELMNAVSELTKEKTVIMIAHRLKTVRNADQIVVIDKGRIAEQGKHEELVAKGGIYAKFIDSRKQAVSWKL